MKTKMIIYQVLPRIFGNTNTNAIVGGNIHENGCGKFKDFNAATFKAFHKLGATHIWYTGVIEHATESDYSEYGIAKDHPAIVKGKAGSAYAIKDYYDVDPDLAVDISKRMKEFESLIDRTHKAGLKVIIDFVPNHVSRQYKSDQLPKGKKDLGQKDNKEKFFDPQNNFYYIPDQYFQPQFNLSDQEAIAYEEYPAKATGNDCFHPYPSAYDWYETVKLNYGVDYFNHRSTHFDPIPDTWLKMFDILSFWAQKGVDGFRCDMAEMVPVEFWEWVIAKIKKKYPELIFIAEIYNPDAYRDYIHKGGFDYLYDKVGLYDTLKAVIRNEAPATDISHIWQSLGDLQPRMLNFLENHDEQRIASEFFASDAQSGIPALMVSSLMTNSPFMIYFGQELGEKGAYQEGFSGNDGRTTIFDYWSLEKLQRFSNQGKYNTALLSDSEKKIYNQYCAILQIIGREKVFSEGKFFDLMYANHTDSFNPCREYAFVRQFENEAILCVVNFDEGDANPEITIPYHAFEHLSIPDNKITEGTELLSGKTINAPFSSEQKFPVHIKGKSGVIIKFTW